MRGVNMIRLANSNDAAELYRLNSEFNDPEEADIEYIEDMLESNSQEFVVVSENLEKHILNGYICVQLKRSMAHSCIMPEMTEVFVQEEYRRQGIAKEMIAFAELYIKSCYPVKKLELLTRKDNFIGQALYRNSGFSEDIEMHMSKKL